MSEARQLMHTAVKEPWLYSVLLLSITPLFPDYCCFILVFVAFALAAIDACSHNRPIGMGKLGVMLLLYFGYMAVSLVYSTDIESTFWTLVMWLCMFLGYLSFITVLVSRERLRGAMLCMSTVTGTVGGITVLQYILRTGLGLDIGDKFWNAVDKVVYGWLNMPLSTTSFGERVSSTFNNPNLLAAYLVLTIPFSVAFAVTGRRSKPKTGARLALVLSLYALGFTFCRGAYLAVLAIGGLLLLFFVRKRFIVTVLAVLYVTLLIPPSISGRLLSALPDNTNQSADSVQNEMQEMPQPPEDVRPSVQEQLEHITSEVTGGYQHDDSVSSRFSMWEVVLKKSLRQPLFGRGAGVGTTVQTLEEAGMDFKHAHNMFLELFAQGGILALLLFFGVLWLLCQRGVRLLRQREKSREAVLFGFAILSSCMALCMMGLFDFPLLTPRIIVTAMLLMAVAECTARIYLNGREIVS